MEPVKDEAEVHRGLLEAVERFSRVQRAAAVDKEVRAQAEPDVAPRAVTIVPTPPSPLRKPDR